MSRAPVHAILWDFDNTLVDTSARNRSVTRRIVATLTGRDPDVFPALRDQRTYDREAGMLWTDYQLTDTTPTRWFPGIPRVVRRLGAWPQGIVSMNTRGNIEAALERRRVREEFALIIGCEQVRYERLKPDPESRPRARG